MTIDVGNSLSVPNRKSERTNGHHPRDASTRFVGAFGPLFSLTIAVCSLVWLYVVFNPALVAAGFSLTKVGRHLLAGESFATDLLSVVEKKASADASQFGCDASAWENLAIVRVSLVDAAFESNDAGSADRHLSGAKEAIERVLACSPGSTLAWTLLAWIEQVRNDDTPHLRELVQMSFRTGPFEGWPLVRRLEIMLRFTAPLSETEKKQIADQSRWLLQFSLWNVLADFYMVGSDAQKDMLYPIFAEADRRTQKLIAQYIRQGGASIDLPLVEPEGNRPWR